MIAVLEADTRRLLTASTDYWSQARRPLVSLFFVLPMLVCYELGVLWLGTGAMRNGADIWLQQFLTAAGISGFLLLPVLTVTILLAWHHTTGQPWRVSGMVLYAMAAESALFAFLLLAIACLQSNVLSIVGVIEPCQLPGAEVARDAFGRMVRYFGAGIYEELLFRLLLVPATMAAIGLAFASRRVKIAGALLLTSLIFSAAHYVGPHGDAFAWHSFSFRFLAGALFAGLFVYRGFGIAAGTHALYDVLVGFPSP